MPAPMLALERNVIVFVNSVYLYCDGGGSSCECNDGTQSGLEAFSGDSLFSTIKDYKNAMTNWKFLPNNKAYCPECAKALKTE